LTIAIDATRLIGRLKELGQTGRDEAGRLCRVAASDADKGGRDLFSSWLKQAGLRIAVDRIGNIYGIWEPEGASGDPVIFVPSRCGISHNPAEFTADSDLIAGTNVLLDVARRLSQ
jgi:N-carbamoyl-L-amino-acid hydrolase